MKPKDRSKEADAMKKQRLVGVPSAFHPHQSDRSLVHQETAKLAVVSAQARAKKEQKEVVEKATVKVAAKEDDSSRTRVSFA